MTTKGKAFSRGYGFKNFEGQPLDKLIQIGIPQQVIIPLRQGFGNEVLPLVKDGQEVVAGQIIGRDDESVSSPVHSSVNGRVGWIKQIDYLGRQTNAVAIEFDGTSGGQTLEGHSTEWQKLPHEKLEELLYLSGASSLGRAGIPTRFKSSIISPPDVEDLIVHGVGSELHNLSLTVLLQDEKLSHFIQGLKILQKVMTNARLHLALDKSQKDLREKVSRSLADNNSIHVYGLEPKYPLDYDEVLIPTLLGREFPYGYSAANIGVVVLDIQAVLQVYQAVVEGKPLIERTIALCGPGFKENLHTHVRIGTTLKDIVKERCEENKDWRFVRNSTLTGATFSDLSLPVDRACNTIIALSEDRDREFLAFMNPGLKKDAYSRTALSCLFKKGSETFKKNCGTNLHGEARPCIFCSFCEEVCPVAIIPHHIYHYAERNIINETLLNIKIFNCIECNLCSYVCPSKIPVAKYIKEGQQKLINEGFDRPLPKLNLKGVEEYKSIK